MHSALRLRVAGITWQPLQQQYQQKSFETIVQANDHTAAQCTLDVPKSA